MTRTTRLLAALAAAAVLAAPAAAAPVKAATATATTGTVDLKSAGPLAVGPNGVLFVADPQGAAVFAIETGDRPAAANGPVKMAKVDERIAGMLGTTAGEINIADMVADPASGMVYFSVARGRGPEAPPALLRLNRQGEFSEVPLKEAKFTKATLPDATTKNKTLAITGMVFVDDKLFVAGLTNEEFSSKLRVLPYPFKEADRGTGVEIFHASHNKMETNSPIRTFTAYSVGGQAHLLASYTCTPLVRIPVAQLKPGEKIKGTTIAELGNGNQPLDMVVYTKGGEDYLLMTNNRRGVMKIPLKNVGTADGLTVAVKGGGTAGMPFETIANLKGVEQLTKLDNEHALILVKAEGGRNLETIDLP
jgi:hypothetical protein